jgi:hypothetical protein
MMLTLLKQFILSFAVIFGILFLLNFILMTLGKDGFDNILWAFVWAPMFVGYLFAKRHGTMPEKTLCWRFALYSTLVSGGFLILLTFLIIEYLFPEIDISSFLIVGLLTPVIIILFIMTRYLFLLGAYFQTIMSAKKSIMNYNQPNLSVTDAEMSKVKHMNRFFYGAFIIYIIFTLMPMIWHSLIHSLGFEWLIEQVILPLQGDEYSAILRQSNLETVQVFFASYLIGWLFAICFPIIYFLYVFKFRDAYRKYLQETNFELFPEPLNKKYIKYLIVAAFALVFWFWVTYPSRVASGTDGKFTPDIIGIMFFSLFTFVVMGITKKLIDWLAFKNYGKL